MWWRQWWRLRWVMRRRGAGESVSLISFLPPPKPDLTHPMVLPTTSNLTTLFQYISRPLGNQTDCFAAKPRLFRLVGSILAIGNLFVSIPGLTASCKFAGCCTQVQSNPERPRAPAGGAYHCQGCRNVLLRAPPRNIWAGLLWEGEASRLSRLCQKCDTAMPHRPSMY